MKKITIAIDGFSSTGKSTLAKQVAKELGYVYVDTGAMYRAVTYFAMQQNLIDELEFNVKHLIELLPTLNLTFQFNPSLGFAEMHLDGINIEKEIRTLEVSNYVSKIAEISEVRTLLVNQQKQMGIDKGVVMDGRDIGTVVFPDAEVKLFMTSRADVRAQRRFDELTEKGQLVSYDRVLENVLQRDHIDTTRKDSPLVKANDAIEIDNSELTREEQFEWVMNIIKEKI
ncbi:(d)CMP kinase [Flavobacterium columnare]|uniref:Cytidylate kinase n=2 Tax=Flavobacterium columnare TaxID=996 RepID=G8X7A4_FLACA|nr:(d)CMP kinase [Flavobacterium columnare]AEW84918.1 cytidylate kinase [Flavobacterium columnare ATCC 49512]AMO19265.1 (d)CMP kinase [Flavobacterium columnare]AUX17201.1 cytidylate kinase [Flavobacterium columnare]MBF6653597.1 (d)CMP kinase [Flavobacterium columnare]MBF6655366.1 (d)CMP kinase [Flavobacterium columnare]